MSKEEKERDGDIKEGREGEGEKGGVRGRMKSCHTVQFIFNTLTLTIV